MALVEFPWQAITDPEGVLFGCKARAIDYFWPTPSVIVISISRLLSGWLSAV
ncbi:MAG: hypothetical protein R3C68_06640 [Myxococcota bacterium]